MEMVSRFLVHKLTKSKSYYYKTRLSFFSSFEIPTTTTIMMFKSIILSALLGSFSSSIMVNASPGSLRQQQQMEMQEECKIVDTVENFDLEMYVSKTWYVQQQAVTRFNPVEQNFCSNANYSIREEPTFWGYTVNVDNFAKDREGNEFGGPLCAFQEDEDDDDDSSSNNTTVGSKLRVAPCSFPKFVAGPYWIVAYDEIEGYALVSGGQPTIPSLDPNEPGCRVGTGVTNSGLWIFTRNPDRDEALITTVRTIATEKGFDLSVLNDVNQEGCYDDDDNDGNTNEENLVGDINEDENLGNDGDDVEEDNSCIEDSEVTFGTTLFGGSKDCAWVSESTFFRCWAYANNCPVTCGRCE